MFERVAGAYNIADKIQLRERASFALSKLPACLAYLDERTLTHEPTVIDRTGAYIVRIIHNHTITQGSAQGEISHTSF